MLEARARVYDGILNGILERRNQLVERNCAVRV